jgi:hypothetical protein
MAPRDESPAKAKTSRVRRGDAAVQGMRLVVALGEPKSQSESSTMFAFVLNFAFGRTR